jgi:hypothetical protein
VCVTHYDQVQQQQQQQQQQHSTSAMTTWKKDKQRKDPSLWDDSSDTSQTPHLQYHHFPP